MALGELDREQAQAASQVLHGEFFPVPRPFAQEGRAVRRDIFSVADDELAAGENGAHALQNLHGVIADLLPTDYACAVIVFIVVANNSLCNLL